MEGIENKHGHRKRLKDRFYKSPIRTLPDYEILEMLLFNVIPIKDTKLVAKSLLKEFGSLAGVINAEYSQLNRVKGLGKSAEIYFKLLKDLFSRLHIPSDSNKKFHILNNWSSVINYCNLKIIKKNEYFNDNNYSIIYILENGHFTIHTYKEIISISLDILLINNYNNIDYNILTNIIDDFFNNQCIIHHIILDR